MDVHVVMVCVLAVGFLLVVAGLGDKPGKKQARTRQSRQQRRQTLPRPQRRRY